MWLHDFLPNDVKNIRILTYGYNTKLIGESTTGETLLDYRRNFIQQLENSRQSDKVCSSLAGAAQALQLMLITGEA